MVQNLRIYYTITLYKRVNGNGFLFMEICNTSYICSRRCPGFLFAKVLVFPELRECYSIYRIPDLYLGIIQHNAEISEII